MFQALQLEVLDRFTAVEQHFRATKNFRGTTAQTAKGMVFVQVYAIHEYTVRRAMQAAAVGITAHHHAYADLRPSLLALSLESDLQSAMDCSARDRWARRIALFARATSQSPAVLPNSPSVGDGTHYRHTHLQLILNVLGIKRKLTTRRRHFIAIDETVDHRNSIAHGGETPAEVGRRYSRGDIWRVIRRARRICLRFIALVSEHCSDPARHCR